MTWTRSVTSVTISSRESSPASHQCQSGCDVRIPEYFSSNVLYHNRSSCDVGISDYLTLNYCHRCLPSVSAFVINTLLFSSPLLFILGFQQLIYLLQRWESISILLWFFISDDAYLQNALKLSWGPNRDYQGISYLQFAQGSDMGWTYSQSVHWVFRIRDSLLIENISQIRDFQTPLTRKGTFLTIDAPN